MKTIIFDFGNVIGYFDHRKTLRRLAAYTDLSMEEMAARFRATSLENDFESGFISAANFVDQTRTLLRLTCPADEFAAAWVDIFQRNEHVHDLILSLRGRYRILLGSNTNELHADQFRRQFADTLQHFHHLVLSHEVGARKPRREFFEHCQRHAEGEPRDCLFIDDLPENVAGAQAHGWHGIVYSSGADLRPQLCELGIAC